MDEDGTKRQKARSSAFEALYRRSRRRRETINGPSETSKDTALRMARAIAAGEPAFRSVPRGRPRKKGSRSAPITDQNSTNEELA